MTIGAFGVYMLEASMLLILFYIFNKQLLARETLHRLNRFLWLSAVAASFLLPLVAPLFVSTEVVEPLSVDVPNISIMDITALGVIDAEPSESPLGFALFVLASIYVVGAIVLTLYYLVSYFSLIRLVCTRRYNLARSTKEADVETLLSFRLYEEQVGVGQGVHYIVHDRNLAPFSWLNFVVLSREDLAVNGREIIVHELSHVAQRHSYDVILLNFVTILLWFNPAAWLTKRALQQVHEYCADDSVLSLGVDAKTYQLLLIRKAVGTRLYTISNSLNHSNLKNRITMMLKKKSPRVAAAKCLYAIPVAIAAIALFASPAFAKQAKSITEVEVTNYFIENKIEGKIESTAEEPNFQKNSTKAVIKNGKMAVEITSDASGKKSYVSEYPIETAEESITYLVDGKQVSEEQYKALDPDRFEVIMKLKEKFDNVEKLGGDISGEVKLYIEAEDVEDVEADQSVAMNDLTSPLYFVNGVVVANGEDIDPKRVESVKIIKKGDSDEWKNHKAWEIKSPNDYNGIIEIILRDPLVAVDKTTEKVDYDNFRLTINGEDVDAETFKSIDMDKVLNVSVNKSNNKVIEMILKDGETIASAQKSAAASDKKPPFFAAEEMPQFKEGGDLGAFRNWVMMRLRYPEQAAKDKIQGMVTLSFIIESDGAVEEVEPIGKPNEDLYNEAKRVVLSSSGMWTPAVQDGKKVRVKYLLPVIFELASEDDAPTTESVPTSDNSVEPITVVKY